MQKTEAVVFVVHDTYQIMVPTDTSSLMWVRVGNQNYYDECNGILCSEKKIHRMTVPAEALNRAKCYTICERKIIERKAYYSQTGEVKETEISFFPVKEGNVRCFHVADAHNRIEEVVRAAQNYGDIDFLIMNGDVPEDSSKIENFDTIYGIASQITHGQFPVIFARGNHDLRGIYAERLIDYCPHENGRSYYTFRVGNIWGIVLDCGEDKDDGGIEYGNTICCHAFRERETEFLNQVITQKEYEEEGIDYKIIIVHNPFTQQLEFPFNIEEELYRHWALLLKKHINPDVLICGHLHRLEVHTPVCNEDHLGQPCPVIIGAKPGEDYFAGAGILFDDKGIHVTFVDSDGNLWEEEV